MCHRKEVVVLYSHLNWSAVSIDWNVRVPTVFSLNFFVSLTRIFLNFSSFSFFLPSSSSLALAALTACFFSISCLFLICATEFPWLKVFSNPPNKRLPRFFSSWDWLLRLCAFVSWGSALGDGGEFRRIVEWSALGSVERRGRFEGSWDVDDALRFCTCGEIEAVSGFLLQLAPRCEQYTMGLLTSRCQTWLCGYIIWSGLWSWF